MSHLDVKKVAVLGAGVMGAQIAAHFVNVQVPVILFDLPAPEGAKNAVVQQAVEKLKKLKPAPLALVSDAALISTANYEQDLERLRECDLIIEAVAERMDIKLALYQSIAPHVAPHAILASNTSGLSITELSAVLPAALRPQFCGIHFFNPPRYMYLVELIATPQVKPQVLDDLETFVTRTLGKGVVRALDTPNFIANRVGIAGMLATMKEAEQFGLSFDVVDDLTGKKLGRASSATFRTADVVGLDTLRHVIRTLQDKLSLQTDPFYDSYATPAVLTRLIDMGHLGQKAKAGFFKKQDGVILRFDAASGNYIPADQKADELVARILKKPAAQRLKLLRESQHPHAQFVWAILRDQMHYVAVHLAQIADTARDVDLAMRWGFGNQQGPFELWQEAGWLEVANAIQADIDAGRALSKTPLPAWVFEGPVAQAQGVHTTQGSWSAAQQAFVLPRDLPVYQRQLFPPRVGGLGADFTTAGETVFEDDAIRLWTLDAHSIIASIKTKMHVLNDAVGAGLHRAVDLAEQAGKAVVIWSDDAHFCAGADLQTMLPAFMQGGLGAIDELEHNLQRLMLRMRYSRAPVVAALRGYVLGGGCELAVYCARRVAVMESYVGLVEIGVGLLPGAGGLTYIARRAAELAARTTHKDLLPFLTPGLMAAAMAQVSTSAHEARQLGYLQDSDPIIANPYELLHVALQEAQALLQANYRPPQPRLFAVAGRSAIATVKGLLLNQREGGFISEHDSTIAAHIAHVVCGGEVDAGTLVDEHYLMALERKGFGELISHPKTHERIMGMLETGKPLRN